MGFCTALVIGKEAFKGSLKDFGYKLIGSGLLFSLAEAAGPNSERDGSDPNSRAPNCTFSPVISADPGISTADTGTLEAGGIRRLGSLMCLGCGWWTDTMFSTAMVGSCKSLLTVEGPSPGVDSRCFVCEGKDSKPGGGTLTAWFCCCCRWLNWLRTGDGSG